MLLLLLLNQDFLVVVVNYTDHVPHAADYTTL